MSNVNKHTKFVNDWSVEQFLFLLNVSWYAIPSVVPSLVFDRWFVLIFPSLHVFVNTMNNSLVHTILQIICFYCCCTHKSHGSDSVIFIYSNKREYKKNIMHVIVNRLVTIKTRFEIKTNHFHFNLEMLS